MIELRGDIKALSEEIKTLLEVALARPAAGESSSGGVASTSESGVAVARPFALCNGVAPGSPAAQAVSILVATTSGLADYPYCVLQGMLQGDKLVRFGSIDAENNQNLRAVATETQNNEGVGHCASCLQHHADIRNSALSQYQYSGKAARHPAKNPLRHLYSLRKSGVVVAC